MNENKRLIIVGVVILVVIALILVISFWPKPDKSFACGVRAIGDYKKLGSINYKQYECLMEEEGKNVIVVSDKMTDKKKSALNDTAKSIGHVIYYVNTDKIDASDLKTIKKELKYKDSSFKKDVILVVNDGKVEDYEEGILTSTDDLKAFLKEADLAKFACDAVPNEEYENLGEVDLEGYKCLYESDETFVLMISQTTCGYCKQFKPFINEYVGKNEIPMYFIEVNTLSDSDRQDLLSSLSYFDDNESWGTPLTLGIKDKEVIANLSGYTEDKDEVDNFFETIGLK